MIKTFIFDAEINADSVYNLIEIMDNFLLTPDLNPDILCKVYFNTNGGACYLAETLIDYFNSYPLNLELVISGECASAGITVASQTMRDISILPTAYGMIHKASGLTESRTSDLKGTIDYFIKNVYDKELNDYYMDIYKNFDLTKKELNIIQGNKDLYLSNKRLCEIILGYREKVELNNRIDNLEQELAFLKAQRGDEK